MRDGAPQRPRSGRRAPFSAGDGGYAVGAGEGGYAVGADEGGSAGSAGDGATAGEVATAGEGASAGDGDTPSDPSEPRRALKGGVGASAGDGDTPSDPSEPRRALKGGVGASAGDGATAGEGASAGDGATAGEGASAGDGDTPSDPSEPRRALKGGVGAQIERLVGAIRDGDDEMVERAVISLSQRNRLLTPLALLVGAFAMLFQGIKLLFSNWRLTLVQVLPAMWIWAAMLDLKVHVFHGKEFHILRGPLLVPVLAIIAAITVASFFLNAVFAFAIATPGEPEIRPAFAEARAHWRPIVAWGSVIGLALGFSAMVVRRWGLGWFALSLGIVAGVMMLAYVAVPSRLVGVKSDLSRRDQITATAVGGAVGAMVCSPPYFLGRVAILMLGSERLRVLAVVLLAVAVVLETGATSATKAIKMSSKIIAGRPLEDYGSVATEPSREPSTEPSTEPSEGRRNRRRDRA